MGRPSMMLGAGQAPTPFGFDTIILRDDHRFYQHLRLAGPLHHLGKRILGALKNSGSD
jgi:hypothetical protein